jgi:hypothetical protein
MQTRILIPAGMEKLFLGSNQREVRIANTDNSICEQIIERRDALKIDESQRPIHLLTSLGRDPPLPIAD